MQFDDIASAIRDAGLTPRGGFHPSKADAVPTIPDGTNGNDVATLILIGNAGDAMWRKYRAANHSKTPSNPLDRWSERVITQLAERFDAHPLFPFTGPPYLPFQRWAQRAEAVSPSPLGILIHPVYGLWHAFRGALAFPTHIELPPREDVPSPCDTCIGRPCLGTCPVNAFSTDGYNVPACLRHVESSAGRACRDHGCLARRACPIGPQYRYSPSQARFHMQAFLGATD